MISFQKRLQFVDQRYFFKQKAEVCSQIQKEALHKIAILKQCHQIIKHFQSQDSNSYEISNDL